MSMEDRLTTAAQRLADILKDFDLNIVFAESCTAGLVSATLARIPGISNHLCGSAVVYRVPTKKAWLDVLDDAFDQPGDEAVTPDVAIGMAKGVLERTPEAVLAIAITGHLGPGAPDDKDGLVYVSGVSPDREGHSGKTVVEAFWLSPKDFDQSEETLRVVRQHEAAACVLEFARSFISGGR